MPGTGTIYTCPMYPEVRQDRPCNCSLMLFGRPLELKARSPASAALESLLVLAPKTVRRIAADGTQKDVPAGPCAHR